jgi:hypothetical protein
MRIGHQSGPLLSSTATLGYVVFAIVARPIASMCGHKPTQPRVAVLLKALNARPRPGNTGTRCAQWPPAGRRSLQKILRRGGGPCPGFRRAARKGFWPVELNIRAGSKESPLISSSGSAPACGRARESPDRFRPGRSRPPHPKTRSAARRRQRNYARRSAP